MARIEIPQELILPMPRDDREKEIFLSLQEAFRNVYLVLENLANANTLSFCQTASATVSNTTTETTVVSSGSGSTNIQANFMQAGKKFRVKGSGYYSNTVTPTLRMRVKIGTVTVLDSTAFTTSLGAANNQWDLEGVITCRSVGASGTVIGQGTVSFNTSGTTAQIVQMVNTSTATVDTTIANTVDLTVQWGTASASNTITCTDFTVEAMN